MAPHSHSIYADDATVGDVNSDIINKLAKAREYAQHPERVSIERLEIRFQGNNQSHRLIFGEGVWQCDCDFFHAWQTCSHTMALTTMLDQMLQSTPAKQVLPSRN